MNGYGVSVRGGGSRVMDVGLNGVGLLSPDSVELAELASASTQSTLPPDSGIASSNTARYTSLRQAPSVPAARLPSALANRAIPPRPFPQSSADESIGSQARLLPSLNAMNPLTDPNNALSDFGEFKSKKKQ